MMRINLLSSRFIEERARRERRRLNVMLSSAMFLGLVAWMMIGWLQLNGINLQIAAAQNEIAPLQDQCQAARVLKAQLEAAAERSRSVNELRESIPTTAVLALITQLTPPEIDLSGMTVDVPDPTESSASSTWSLISSTRTSIRIKLEGSAGDDVTIARFVSTLAEHAATSNVRLVDSRKATIGQVTRNTFQVSLEIPLFTTTTSQEQAGP